MALTLFVCQSGTIPYSPRKDGGRNEIWGGGSKAREEEREGKRRVGELIAFGVGVRDSLALVLEIFRVLEKTVFFAQ